MPAMYPDTSSCALIFIVTTLFIILCKFVYLAASSWQKGEHIIRFKPTQPEKVMAAHGSKEDFSFHKRPFFFTWLFTALIGKIQFPNIQ